MLFVGTGYRIYLKLEGNQLFASGLNSDSTEPCMGVGTGSKCPSNADCGTGLYCEKDLLSVGGYCRDKKNEGQWGYNDYECRNDLGCHRYTEVIGTCTLYFSVPVGGPTYNCMEDSTSLFCATGNCAFDFQYSPTTLGPCISLLFPI